MRIMSDWDKAELQWFVTVVEHDNFAEIKEFIATT